MTPTSPVLPSRPDAKETVYAKDQPEYLPLPVIKSAVSGMVTSRWRLSWRERIAVLLGGSIYLQQLTFNTALQPIKPSAYEPAYRDCL